MWLTVVKILTTLITAGLAVFAVNTDFTDKETKKLKPAGKRYIGFFLFSVALSFIFDSFSEKQKAEQFNNLLKTESENLNSVQQIFNQVNSITAPLAPIQIVFRVKYPLKKAILENESGIKYFVTGQAIGDGTGDWVPIVEEYDDVNDRHVTSCGLMDDDMINQDVLKKWFHKTYIETFSFYTDSLMRNASVDYCDATNYCGKKYDNIYYEKSDSCLIRETTITCNAIYHNSTQILSLKDLVNASYIHAEFGQGGKNRFDLIFKKIGKQEVSFNTCFLEPYIVIKYGKNFSLHIDNSDEKIKVFPQQFGVRLSHSKFNMKLKINSE
jgi:hypothetical protein